VERMRAAVVVARSTAHGGNIYAVRKDTNKYVETEPAWKQLPFNS
jgi:hypothetical protein